MTLSKRTMILEKSIELFSIKGFEATSIQEITEHCGISKGAFYLSFKSKEELIISIIEHLMNKFMIEIDQAVNSKSIQDSTQLERFYEAVLRYTKKNRTIAVFLLTEQQQLQHSHKEIFQYLSVSDRQLSKKIADILEEAYGSTIHYFKEDLILCVKSLCKTYGEYVLLNDVQIDFTLLSLSLTEKTNALAFYKHEYALPNSFFKLQSTYNNQTEEAKSSIQHELTYLIKHEKNPLLKESLILLHKEWISPQPSMAMINGMLANLEKVSSYYTFCYTVRKLIAH